MSEHTPYRSTAPTSSASPREAIMVSSCYQCGGFRDLSEVGARYARHHDECTCIVCEECGDVTGGNRVESDAWNEEQRAAHEARHTPTV